MKGEHGFIVGGPRLARSLRGDTEPLPWWKDFTYGFVVLTAGVLEIILLAWLAG